MRFTLFNDNWRFWEVRDSFSLNWETPEDARSLNLPHDAMIEIAQDPEAKFGTNSGYRRSGIFSYSKHFYAADPDRTYILKIEGAYMNAYVYVNGQLAAKRPYGYSVFYVPLNKYVDYGKENEIRIQVRSGAEPNSRWYPGAGVYRDVYLLEGGRVYFQPDRVRITTIRIPDVSHQNCNEGKTAEIAIDALLVGPGLPENGMVKVHVSDPFGETVADQCFPVNGPIAEDDSAAGYASKIFTTHTAAEEKRNLMKVFSAQIEVSDPSLWSAETPNLYHCELSYLDESGNIKDIHTETFGIRLLQLSPENGLRVNGEEIKLRGACIHHDSGLLGTKTYEEVHLRQVRKLKETGFNAIRSAHNPAAPALLRACDQVGMYVMDEAFDMWTRHKSDGDYGMYFSEWWEADIEAMVNNDYNHPSVIFYSIGNEIPEIATRQSEYICKTICDKIHSMDSDRYTLVSVNGIFSVGTQLDQIVHDVAEEQRMKGLPEGNVNDFMAFMHDHMEEMTQHPIVDEVISKPFQYVDVAGYNYMGGRYEMDGILHPDRVIVGSESGISFICSNWKNVLRHSYLIGDFCWSGWEYLGEVGIGYPNYSDNASPFGNEKFPMQISCTGDLDITGHRLPMSYYREIIYGLRKDPYIAVQDPAHFGDTLVKNPWIMTDAVASWNWKEADGKAIVVEVYSNGDEVELFLNDISLGRQCAGSDSNYRVLYETVYKPGTLRAVSYEKGEVSGSWELSTTGMVSKLIIREESELKKTAIRYYDIELVDDMGNVVPDNDMVLHLTLDGAVQLLGFGSADPLPEFNYTEYTAKTYRGRAQLILRQESAEENTRILISY